jgi:hypothetical protein
VTSWGGSWDEKGPVGSLEQSEPGPAQAEYASDGGAEWLDRPPEAGAQVRILRGTHRDLRHDST